jgi:hypothetical protein
MFVKAFSQAFEGPVEVDLYSSTIVPYRPNASEIQAEGGQRSYYSQHPPEIVRKALKLYAGFLSGREETQIHFPGSPLSNVVPEPQSVSGVCLDLTKENIEITEEMAPVDAEGNIQLDAPQTRVRTLSYDKEVARKRAEAEAPKAPHIGQTIAGKGVFAGVWEPKDRDGKSLGKRFNVFATPQDLTDSSGKKILMQFKEAVERMTALSNWHDHDGVNFANDTAVYTALKNGSYNGEWFIPTRDLLSDNLYSNKDQGDLKGSFATNGSGLAVWYWSCTEPRDHPSIAWNVRFSDGDGVWGYKDGTRLSCRPCRVEALVI